MQSASRVRRPQESPAKASGKPQKSVSRPSAGSSGELATELRQVTSILEDYKAQHLTVIPLAGQASFADYLVIATGTSTRHVSSMGSALQDKIGKSKFLGLEGMTDGEWVCADMGSIVIHLFTSEKRALYNLEKLWSYAFPESSSETE